MAGTTRKPLGMILSAAAAGAAVAAGLSAADPAAASAAAMADGATSPQVTVAPCTSAQLVASSAQRLASGQVVVTVVNHGSRPCVLKGYPTVALAGMGSPERNKPLQVVRQGASKPVTLAVGGRASTQLTFTPVLGEASGYCASGAAPFVAPSIVVGVAGGGRQLAPDDGGDFALCGTSVRATAFRATGA
ncbi:DUF4232 domain-containing protein [Streptomyces sp. NPDC093984]|uniref:DUF4232 domain-containing protein n=1 Tax=Streptomyces sp. NPDC093984 TaxID=3366052 RepID=UPI00382109B1